MKKKILLSSLLVAFTLNAEITYYVEPQSVSLDVENAALTFSCPEAYELVKDKSQIYEKNKVVKKYYCKRIINKQKYNKEIYNKIQADINE
jgi:formylmethanofuran dehydrogenase subunit A